MEELKVGSMHGTEGQTIPKSTPALGILEMPLHPALRPRAAYLAGRHVEGPCPQIHSLPVIDEGQQQDHTRSLRCPDAAQTEDDHSLIGGHDLDQKNLN